MSDSSTETDSEFSSDDSTPSYVKKFASILIKKWNSNQTQENVNTTTTSDSSTETDSELSSNYIPCHVFDSDSDLSENSNQTWENFFATCISEDTYNQQCYNLLKTEKSKVTSTLGDICFTIGHVKFTLDRTVLASKSNYLFEQLTLNSKNDVAEEIKDLMNEDASRFSNIVDIIYGKDLKSVIEEANFLQLFVDMIKMGMEIDLKIFKDFIDETIKPQAELNDRMLVLYDILSNSDDFDYLLSSISSYFSDRLLKIYYRKEFVSFSNKGIVQILLNKSENSLEKGSVGNVCAEWICYDYENRIKTLKDLVNVAKYRYGILPYCDWDPNVIKSLPKKVPEVEKYFNRLMFHHGIANFEIPSNLKDELNRGESGVQIAHPINQGNRWTEILEKSLFCDVAINVQGTIFKLHRIKLLLASPYFRHLFTSQNESSVLQTRDESSSSESTMMEHSLDQLDPVTFQSLIEGIYQHEIEVNSETQVLHLIKYSKFLKMDRLFEECSYFVFEMTFTDHLPDLRNIFEAFQCACENAKYSELYDSLAEKVRTAWSAMSEDYHESQFTNISLDTLLEILVIPYLKIEFPDEIVDHCTKWIFHDIENRYPSIIEIAKAINRNYMMDDDQLELEIPSNFKDCTLKYVKNQLTRILSSTTLVPLNSGCIQNERQPPSFLLLNEDKYLCVVDSNFNKIAQLAQIEKPICPFSATMINDDLFVLFNIGKQFYFQLYSLATNRMISLAIGTEMYVTDRPDFCSAEKYAIFNCNNKVYYCDKSVLLKYMVKQNRWILLDKNTNWWDLNINYASDGEKIYRIIANKKTAVDEWTEIKASYYDFKQWKWIPLQDIPVVRKKFTTKDANGKEIHEITNTPIKANVVDHEVSVLFSSNIYKFNWESKKWKNIFIPKNNFVDFCGRQKDIVYITAENEIRVYSPGLKKLVSKKTLPNVSNIVPIHIVEK